MKIKLLKIILYLAIPFGVDGDDKMYTGTMGGALDVLDDFGPKRIGLGLGMILCVGFYLVGKTLNAVVRHTTKRTRLGMKLLHFGS